MASPNSIIENKLKEHELTKSVKRKVVKFGQSINLGQLRVEFMLAMRLKAAMLSPWLPVVMTTCFSLG